MQSLQIRQQFILMQFGSGFNQTLLAPWQGTGNQLHRVDAKNPHFILIIGVKVGDAMLRPCKPV